MTAPKGERHWKAKLDWPRVREIRRLVGLGFRDAELARRFDVGRDAIRGIRLNVTWRDDQYEPVDIGGRWPARVAPLRAESLLRPPRRSLPDGGLGTSRHPGPDCPEP